MIFQYGSGPNWLSKESDALPLSKPPVFSSFWVPFMFDHLPSSGKRRLTTFQGSTYMASQPISLAPKYPVSRVMVNSPYPITGLSNVTNPTQLLRYMCIEF